MPYPSIEDVMQSCRIKLNDLQQSGVDGSGNPIYGRIFPDTAWFALPLLNEAVAQLQRDLDNLGWAADIQEFVIYDIPVIWGKFGQASPDPAAQQNLNFTGFFNGSAQIGSPVLPENFIQPLRLWQRVSNSAERFAEFNQSTPGLISANQGNYLGNWEWRGNAIWWNGATELCDVRIRGQCANVRYTALNANPADFGNIYLPFLDNEQPLAAWMAASFSRGRPNIDPTPLFNDYEQSKTGMADRIVKGKQGSPVMREPFDTNEGEGW